jgi:hypothetical protein
MRKEKTHTSSFKLLKPFTKDNQLQSLLKANSEDISKRVQSSYFNETMRDLLPHTYLTFLKPH